MKRVIVCNNHRSNPTQPSCAVRGGGDALADRLEQEVATKGLNISVERFACLGFCQDGPVIKLAPGGRFICHVSAEKIDGVMQEIEAFSKQAD